MLESWNYFSSKFVLASLLISVPGCGTQADKFFRVAEDMPDPLCPNPVEEIAKEMEYVKDSDLFRKYALWIVARDVDRGLSVSCPDHVQWLAGEEKLTSM